MYKSNRGILILRPLENPSPFRTIKEEGMKTYYVLGVILSKVNVFSTASLLSS